MSANQMRMPLPGGRGLPLGDVGLPTLGATLIGAAGAAYVAVAMPEAYRTTLAIALGLTFMILGMKWPRAAAIGVLLFLPFLGLVRRLLISDTGWTANDPLIVVGPAVALFLFYRLYGLEGRRLSRDLMARLVLGLLLLALLQVFNPFARGNVLSNMGGLIFLAIPLVWFFIGRVLGNERSVTFLMRAVIVVAMAVAAYGLWQIEFRTKGTLPSWDQQWFDVAGYSALKVSNSLGSNNATRAFSTFPSNGEYSTYLGVALIFIFALAVHRRLGWLVALPLLVVAGFASGGRAIIALTLLAAVILAGVRTRNLALGLIVVALGVGAVFGFTAALGPSLDRVAGVSDNAVAERNVSGLLHPLDPNRSSVLGRWGEFLTGIGDGFKNPAGSGTGASNPAGRNLSDDAKGSQETDNDVADVFLSLGAVGGAMYLMVIFLVFRSVFRRYSRTRDWKLFAVAGMLVVVLGNWLTGGLYAVSALFWFLIGWATRYEDPELEMQEEATPAAVTEGRRALAAAAGAR